MAFPFGILVTAMVLFICTCSKKAFLLKIWDYRVTKEKSGLSTYTLEEIRKQQKLDEFAESRLEKRRQYEIDILQDHQTSELDQVTA